MTTVETGVWYGLIPPLQMTSLEVTSVIGCGRCVNSTTITVFIEEPSTYPIISWDTNANLVALVNAVDIQFLRQIKLR